MQKLALASVDEVEKQSNDGHSRAQRTQRVLYAFRPMLSLEELAVTVAAPPVSTEPRSPNGPIDSNNPEEDRESPGGAHPLLHRGV